jgi:hypothetical protein
MTQCRVEKCMSAANEAVEPLPVAGPLCDEHRARLTAGEDWELQGSEQSAVGTSEPTVLMGDSLLALNQYVLLEPPTKLVSGSSRHGHLVPLRVQRRGSSNEVDLTLLVGSDHLRAVAEFFSAVADQIGIGLRHVLDSLPGSILRQVEVTSGCGDAGELPGRT